MEKELFIKKTIKLGIYSGYKIHIIIADNICKARNKYHKELNGLIEEDDGFDGMHSYAYKNYNEAYIFLKPNVTHGTIAHESLHATFRITRMLGNKLNRGSEESYTYLLGYIVDNISDMFIKLNNK